MTDVSSPVDPLTPAQTEALAAFANEHGDYWLAALWRAYTAAAAVQGITFLLFRDGCVLLERCPKKREVLGVGEWFVPGGKLEPGESEPGACAREMREELGVTAVDVWALPILAGSPVPPGPRGLFLMRPFYIAAYQGEVPARTLDGGVPLRWVPIAEALASPVPQVRMMVAAAAAFDRASGQPEAVSP